MSRNVVEIRPAGFEEVEPSIQVRRRQDLALDLGRDVGDAPEIGRARTGDAFDDLEIAGPRERLGQAGALGDGRVARE